MSLSDLYIPRIGLPILQQVQYYIETRTDDLFYFSFQFSLGAGAGTGGCSTVGCRISTTLKPEQMTFLFLISILFGSRGENGLLYSVAQDQYCIETRTDDLSITHFNSLWEQGWEQTADLQRGAG